MSQTLVSSDNELQVSVQSLHVYPVKSCAGISLRESLLIETGLEFDRAWMVVDAQGRFVTQRQVPRMALIQPTLRVLDMVLRAPGMLALHLPLGGVESPRRVRVWDDEVDAWDMGALAAQWFSDFLGRPLRLVRFDAEVRRLSSLKWTGGVEAPNQFSDAFPLLIASQASLDGLNQRLLAAGHAAVEMARFRPNLVLDGIEAHDEDRLDTLWIDTGDAVVQLRPAKPCARCPIPNIDPATAAINPAVSDTLQTYRKDSRLNGAVTFGMNALVLQGDGATLRVGQPVSANFRFD